MINTEGKTFGDISIVFCNDDYLLKINESFLDHDFYTDIITFDYNEANKVAGDLIISIDRVKENAKHFGVRFENELQRVIIHGILHLCGHHDKTKAQEKRIRALEDRYLSELHKQQQV